jgi:NADH pyrophosphatase NudC (nudix superfamily)
LKFHDIIKAVNPPSNSRQSEAPYARANRLYAEALALQDELLIRMDWAKMLRKWAAVYRHDGKKGKARELEADGLRKE